MREIFLGLVFDSNKAEKMLKDSRIGLQMAVNQYQIGFITVIDDICRVMVQNNYRQ